MKILDRKMISSLHCNCIINGNIIDVTINFLFKFHGIVYSSRRADNSFLTAHCRSKLLVNTFSLE